MVIDRKMNLRTGLILIHMYFFASLCGSQISTWQLLSSDFSKDIAMQKLFGYGALISQLNHQCQTQETTACVGVWQCYTKICEFASVPRNVDPIRINPNIFDTKTTCNQTNTKNLISDIQQYFDAISTIFFIMPIIIVLCGTIVFLHSLITWYNNKPTMIRILFYSTIVIFVLLKLLMVLLVILNCLFIVTYVYISGDEQPTMIFNIFLQARISVIVVSIFEMVIGLFELYIFNKIVNNLSDYYAHIINSN